MKQLLLTFTLLFTLAGFTQPISVSSTAYTVPQLVNNVLINSPCVSATNIKWSTGSNFGSSNGIGFFQNTNTNFPLQSGVVLSTGNAYNAAGPNTSMLDDGSTAWPGDIDLETTLTAAGIPMVSKNATVLEFDFTPVSSYFSFDFIFASEEYGNYQCNYSDAFAFLLTDTNTGITQNLAVVPNTNTPISVITIRDFLYNSSCPSSNPEYFGSFNGGSNAATSATNFNGQTTVLTAASILTPNVPYHIKLVIADRLDPQSDSAIFISSNSFNIGQNVLGPDLTMANNTAVCFGTSKTIETGVDPAFYTFEWKKDNQKINGETGPDLTVTEPGTYSVTYTNIFNTCVPVTDNLVVEFLPEIITENPVNAYRCNTGASSYTFNLDVNTEVVKKGLDPLTVVSYHISQNDADSNVNTLPLQYNGTVGQTIYIRIQLPNCNCYTVKSFSLLLAAPPVANQPKDLSKCSKKEDGTATFNLNPQTHVVLGGQSPSIYSVSYYNSMNDATNAINPITELSNGVHPSQTVYVRVQNDSDPACFSITTFELIVNPTPLVDKLANIKVCDEYILPDLTDGEYFTGPNGTGINLQAGTAIIETQTIYIFNQPNGPNTCAAGSSFKVTVVTDPASSPKDVVRCASYTLPKPAFGKYYTEPSGAGTVIPVGTKLTSSQTVYFYYAMTEEPYCSVDTQFEVTINPGIDVGEKEDVFECVSYTLPSLNVGKYYTGPKGTGNIIPEGTAITTSQTIYVYEPKTGPNSCSDEDEFDIFIGMAQPENITQCNSYTLPELPIGNYFTEAAGNGEIIPAGTIINETTTIYIFAPVANGGDNCTKTMFFTITIDQAKIDILNDVSACESYTLPTLTNGEYFTESGGSGIKLYPGHVVLSTQTIYTFARLNDTCYTEAPFTVTINQLPKIDSRSDIDICDQYVLTELNVGNYYTGPNGTGNMINAGTAITASQLIYIYATTNTTPACSVENSFKINVFSANADILSNITACDSYTLPNLTTYNHYYTQPGGYNGSGVEILPGTAITNSQKIYIFKEALIRTAFSCTDETEFTVTINKTPVIPAIGNVNTCENYTLPVLSIGDYYTGSNASGTLLHAGDILTKSQTVYVYAHSGTTPDCSTETSFNVTIFNVDDFQDITTCESYTLPVLTNGKYYTGPNGTGTILAPGTVIKTSQTIYIYGVAGFSPSCIDQVTFKITIIDRPFTNSVVPRLRSTCDEDGINDGITSFDLTNLSDTILGTQTGNEFTVTYYANTQDATLKTNAFTSTLLTTVYARVDNILAPNCYDLEPIKIIVNKLPEPTPIDGFICIDNKTGKVSNPYTIYSNLNPANHKFVWKNEAGQIVGNKNNYTATATGIYSLVATNTTTGCESLPAVVAITASEAPVVAYTVNGDFADTQSITVKATGQGNNFEYQLDNSTFQDSNVFENVTSGVHQITVRDKYGCGSTTIQAIAINYPKFFTPNGDGYNETWNISDLTNQPNAVINIFDRYGKLLKQLRPNDYGWDGTFNGNTVASDDYWFTVSYKDENQMNQEFKAHFALKR